MERLKKLFNIPDKKTYFSSSTTTHHQMYLELNEMVMRPAKYLGANIFDKSHKKYNWLIISMFCLVTFTFVINIYDIYLFRKDLVRCAFCIITLTAAFQSYGKMYTFIFMKENCILLKMKGEMIHQSFKTKKPADILELWMLRAAHIGFFITLMYMIVCCLVVVYPCLFYLIFGERVLHFGIEIPILDWRNSWFAYALNYIHQSTCVICFALASIPAITIVVIFITTAFAYFDILSILLEDLNQTANLPIENLKRHQIKQKIKLIIENHMELIEFLKLLENTFSRFYFIDFLSLIFQKTVVLFAIITFNFIPGYFIIPTIAFQLLVPCSMGTVLGTKVEKYYMDVCKVSWHLMSISDQKSIQMIMKFAILPRQLSAGLKILDMETFVEIYKAIYSYLMLLESFK